EITRHDVLGRRVDRRRRIVAAAARADRKQQPYAESKRSHAAHPTTAAHARKAQPCLAACLGGGGAAPSVCPGSGGGFCPGSGPPLSLALTPGGRSHGIGLSGMSFWVSYSQRAYIGTVSI